jgi:hypothetical protein
MKRALSMVQLDTAISFPDDRNTMPMSTLIASNDWQFDAEWDGLRIGDIQMYKRTESEWKWYAAIPCFRIKTYRWVDGEPEAKPRQAAKGAP